MANDESKGPIAIIEPLAQDLGHLVDLHADLLRSEVREAAGEVSPALASLAAGVGLAGAGGFLGALAIVHVLDRSTRLPLWACYGLVGGCLSAAGLALVGSGAQRLSTVSLVPHETIATLKEDLKWLRDKTT